MRWYRLSIGSGADKLVIQSTTLGGLSYDNPTPLNINFNINIMKDTTSQVCSIIRVYNVSQDVFVKMKSYVGQPIILEAGIDSNSTFAKKLGYESITNKTILIGRIQSVMGNFSTSDTWVAISTGLINTENTQSVNAEDIYRESEGTGQLKEFTIQLEPNKTIGEKVLDSISNFFSVDWLIEATLAVYQLTVKNTNQTLLFTFSTLAQFMQIMRREFNISLTTDASTNPSLAQLYLNDGSDIFKTGRALSVINPGEILSQPMLLAPNKYTMVTVLRPDLHLGSFIKVTGMIPTISGFAGIDTFISKGVADGTKVFMDGYFQINQIHHNGNFYGTSIEDWSTQLELVPTSVDIVNQSISSKTGGSVKGKL